MAARIRNYAALGALSLGALAVSVAALTSVSVAALTFGAGTAGASPNRPGMTDVSPDGSVSSRQADSVARSDYCAVNPGTMGTSTVTSADVSAPMQRAREAGPEWVGSDGGQAIGVNRSYPWGGSFRSRRTGTGTQCKQGSASGFSG